MGDLIHRLAQRLMVYSLPPAAVIAVRLPESIEQVALIWAIIKCGYVVCPIRHSGTDSTALKILTESKAVLIVTDNDSMPGQSVPILSRETLLLNENLLAVPNATVDSIAEIEASHPLRFSCSSGSTGSPKLILSSHEQVSKHCQDYQDLFGWDNNDRLYFNMEMGDSWGCEQCLVTLVLGGTIVIGETDEIAKSAEHIRDGGITQIILLPWQLRLYLQVCNGQDLLFPDIRNVLSSASLLTHHEKEQVRALISPALLDTYSTTEFHFIAIATTSDMDSKPKSAGRINPSVDLEIVDSNHDVMGPNDIGLIRVRCCHMLTRYENDDSANQSNFHDGWFYPQDTGYIDDEGSLFLMGRTDDVIDCKGAKFYPREIENVLSQIPGVRESAVFGWPDKELGEIAVAVISRVNTLLTKDVNDYCRTHLEEFKVPRYYLLLDSLPRAESSKVDYEKLRTMFKENLPVES